ncbi:methyltransferase type 11 [Colletotrichum tofieldiae]|nr:methyltransferase type 11 [Colletotrichum tofieldiae]GKT76364.1 methyltransferase type 11 [Colletotrichum tofieldiae]GKT87407.1 methyltransferase type 11 [Colletotrichum tofieldiae]
MKPLDHFDSTAQSYEKSTGGCARELAERIIPLLNFTNDSVILDSACGSGIVTDVLLQHLKDKTATKIFATDGAPKMVELVQARFSGHHNVTATVMPGESLDFQDATFNHSITSLGLMFFTDAVKGATEIFRTLKVGGTAIVTGWEELGYIPIIRRLQQEIRPSDEPFNLPVSPQWFDPVHTEKILRAGGFEDIEMRSELVHWAAETDEEVASLIVQMFGPFVFKDWNQAEKKRAEELLPGIVSQWTGHIERHGKRYVGFKMKATVALCRK